MNNAESSAIASNLAWFKSSYSDSEGGECVEVAAGITAVHIRDSKDATGPVLTVSRAAWTQFVGLAAGEPGSLAWSKSSYSGTEGGECVEVAAGTASVHIRDSKNIAGPVLTVSRAAWADFVRLASAESGV
jgi:hypothetical protein